VLSPAEHLVAHTSGAVLEIDLGSVDELRGFQGEPECLGLGIVVGI
jgi:hypothetical protein